jgi:hypothetical protein
MPRTEDDDAWNLNLVLEICRDDVAMGHALADAQRCVHRGARTLRHLLRERGFGGVFPPDRDLVELCSSAAT